MLVYGYPGENLITHLRELPKYPVILNYSSSVATDREMYIEIDLLIIVAESIEEFPDIMIPYDHVPLPIKSLFMFYNNDPYLHCDDWLPYIFQLPWEYDIPSAYHFCINDNNDYQIQTYNPFKTYAPFQWEKIVRWRFEGEIGTPLTGYSRNYTKGLLTIK